MTNVPHPLKSHETLSRQKCSLVEITDGINVSLDPNLTNIVVAILPMM
jgi:hypothetical protein